jgi:DNA transformation protein and related proteins
MRDDSFRDFILDQLAGLDGVRCRSMFGGYGLYQGETFFGILHQDRLYFKTDDSTRPEYQRRGMQPFQPNDRQTLKSYYEVPAEVVENREELAAWARKAIAGSLTPRG